MVGSGFPERIGGTISESLLAPDREASRAFPKRAEVDASPVPIAATIALEMIGPIPGTVITLRQQSSLFANASISSITVSIRLSSRRQSRGSEAGAPWCAAVVDERTGIREIRTPNQHARAGQVRSH
jgi:hypothetical protein